MEEESPIYPTDGDSVHQNSGGGRRNDADRILRVLETIKIEGLKGIGNFILLALSSEDPRVKSHVSPIYQSKGKAFNILEILLDSCTTQRRQTGKYVEILKEKLGRAIKTIFADLVDFELKEVMQNKDIHRLPSGLNTDIASEFAFGNFQSIFEEKAPFTWGVSCRLCGLDQEAKQPEIVVDEEEGEGADDNEDDDEDAEDDAENEAEDGGRCGREEQDNEVIPVGDQGWGQRKKAVDRYLRATTLFGIIMNSRNVKVNYFQTMVSELTP